MMTDIINNLRFHGIHGAADELERLQGELGQKHVACEAYGRRINDLEGEIDRLNAIVRDQLELIRRLEWLLNKAAIERDRLQQQYEGEGPETGLDKTYDEKGAPF